MKSTPNPKVNWFFEKGGPWQSEFALLRAIALSSGLEEELKWGHPCYTLHGKNVFLMHGFKAYCALLFHKGALLKDPKSKLVQQTPHVQSARQLRFTSGAEIKRQAPMVKAYIDEAIDLERRGAQVPLKETKAFDMPVEFATRLKKEPALRKAFEGLTPGRQRGYLLHFSGAKQSKTREARIEKNVERILQGKGLDD